jgi:phytanoyl-CoA hydroxylase
VSLPLPTAASAIQTEQLRDVGFIVVSGLIPQERLAMLNRVARAQLIARAGPLEFEADLQYPGAPQSREDVGGETVRRLLDAYGRDPTFREWGTAPAVREWMEAYFREPVLMSRVHHNSLMTKHPLYGSLTGWHRDIRYWSYEREDLVSVWFALGEERVENGALWFVPGSHRREFAADRYDEAKFFRTDLADNAEVLRRAESPRLAPGDAVFFHSNTLHSAGKNLSDAVKFSLVYTYHGQSNAPKPGTRTSSKPDVPLGRSST